MSDIERQIQLEADARYEGMLRSAKSRQYQLATDLKPVRDLLANSLESLWEAILQHQRELTTPEYKMLPKYATAFLSLRHEQLALITIATVLNAICRSQFEEGVAPLRTPLAYDIGQACRIERLLDLSRQREVDVAELMLSRHTTRNARKRAAELARKNDDENDWAKHYRSHHLGQKLVSLALQFARFDGQPIFEAKVTREVSGKRMKTPERIELTPAAAEWIANHPAALAELPTPVYMPTVVPPRSFTAHSADGGYHVLPLKLMKRKPNARARQSFESADMTHVISAVNALQNTDYRINKVVFESMRRAWEAGMFFGVETYTSGELTALKHLMACRFPLAERMLPYQRIYFPCQLDHRSRAYPVPQLINPQSDQSGRSLLEFGEGKVLGERGAYWLKIHIANCYWKGNKVSFEQRIAWFDQHEQEILAFANNPLGVQPIRDKADKPWLFFAACYEWKRYKEEGAGFRSHLPISMDGSCNGYQHLSALARDPYGGRATNLVPDDEPQDIYLEVAELVSIRVQVDAQYREGDDREAARQLLGRIDRSVVKPATMTTPYGVTRLRIYKQLLETNLIKSCKDPEKCARYLAKALEECIPDVAVEGSKIMKWLRAVARTIAKAGVGMAWTSPAGFPVVHEEREPKEVRLATADSTIIIYEDDPARKIDSRKQVDGIVAHLVHSLDAAHMMLTVNRLHRLGLRHFAMVHDSFGVHACDVDLLNRTLREEFVAMHSEPLMANFFKEQLLATGIALPSLPPPGTLDIREVLESPYFFA